MQTSHPLGAGGITLRPMTSVDLPTVLRLERVCQTIPWPAWFFRRLLRGNASCWVLKQSGTTVGFGVVRRQVAGAHIMNLCIAPGHRGQGLGRRLLLHLLTVARHGGAIRAWLEVRPDNRRAIALYRRSGFRATARRKGYYRSAPQRQRDALIMSYTLEQSRGTTDVLTAV